MDNNFYKQLLDSLTEGIYFLNLDQEVEYWNKAAERLSGYSAQDVLGHCCSDNLLRHVDAGGRQLCGANCPMAAAMRDGEVHEGHIYMHHKLGHRVPLFIRSSPMRDETGKIIGAVEIFSDSTPSINVLKEMEELRQEVLSDPLTGVGNRRYADIAIRQLNCDLRDNNSVFGVIFADIDHFKAINDTWGHAVGDMVLTMVAKTINAALRPLDIHCRWGGDEFVIFIPNIGSRDLFGVAERMCTLIKSTWLDHAGARIRVTASFGCATSKADEKIESVLERADKRLYQCKQEGRNGVCFESSPKESHRG
ncbi:sensor domain-containing diguanylate cyclase [Pseudodesulfovibrio sp.]|uniref:sensor domain-containing diguanylate cyclase n=1 Tax=unclassified Pseudodesulfovibrio TaxID=2661612 RepID=UPI003B00E099